jgi:recombination protein RecR
MKYFAAPLEKLVEQFEALPGIGHKTAQRLAFFVISQSEDKAAAFADAILDAKRSIHTCKTCCNLTEDELCPICSDPKRDSSVVCVVTDPKDLIAIERTREYNGLYHVLHGVISPLNNIGPDQLKINELLVRVKSGDIKEVIMATNPVPEGDTTAMFLSRLLEPFEVKVTRLAYGIPVGGHLEFSDQVTLTRALEGRRPM